MSRERHHIVPDARRRNMSAIRGKDTRPELLVRRYLHSQGFRYRLHVKDLPGKPDIVMRRMRTAIFVHGCFWHHHGCANSVWPKTRSAFWRKKILGNCSRDRERQRALARMGWNVRVVWECEIGNSALAKLSASLMEVDKRMRS